MADPIYKQFVLSRTAFYLLLLALFLGFSAHSRAETNPAYTVEGVEVDVTDKNAVAAREKALEEAQVKAYKMLTERFLGTEAAATFKMPDPVTISSLVQDFEITKEQLSSKRYKGTYTVRFRPNAMKSQMATQGRTYSDKVKKPVLVLPVYGSGDQTMLWSDQNPWLGAWRAVPAPKDAMQPLAVPLGDAEDMAQLPEGEGLDYDAMAVQELASRYGADDVAIVVAAPSGAGLDVALYSNGFEGPALVQKMSVTPNPGETPEQLYARAAQKVAGLLRGNWKANAAYAAAPAATVTTTTTTTAYGTAPATAPPIPYTRQALGPATTYNVYARFASVQDWVRMKATLDRAYGVQGVMIRALKPREAMIDVRYAGDINALQMALQNAGITMRASRSGAPIEIFMGSQPQSTIYR